MCVLTCLLSFHRRPCLLERDENKLWKVANMLMGTEVKRGKAAGFGGPEVTGTTGQEGNWGRDGFIDST